MRTSKSQHERSRSVPPKPWSMGPPMQFQLPRLRPERPNMQATHVGADTKGHFCYSAATKRSRQLLHLAALLRAKGLMCVAGDAHPRVVQCVQDVAYPPVRLRAWPHERPFEDGRGRLVFIVRNLASAQIEAIRATLADLPSDIAALRASVADWELPTRCWLSQRVPTMASSTVQHDAWLIQPRHFRTLTNDR